ncbi:MAG: diaminopimelate epimerase [Actinobacteria bacterium]|nr:diaminopimelate epimerase [Actinomycetota bacterium]
MLLNFAKYEGLGNDFIIINDMGGAISLSPDQIARLCNRNFGIGADGLIFARPSALADFFMDYYNSDGSIAEMCGNGIRCYAKYLTDEWLTNKSTISIETRAGVKTIDLVVDNGNIIGARVDMGEPILEASRIPLVSNEERFINQPLTIDSSTIYATCVSMGNPHCIIFVEDLRKAPVLILGPKIEGSERFPQRTNVGFAQVVGENEIALRVWERGCGETLACGTGACATLVACALNNKTDRTATIHLPGGDLSITWGEDNHIIMQGPAARVFTGSIDVK